MRFRPVVISLCAALAMMGLTAAPGAAAEGAPTLVRSATADYANPQPLDGMAVDGKVAVHVRPGTSKVSRVVFSLDGQVVRTESVQPWDLSGDTSSRSHMLDTATLTPGQHTVGAAVTTAAGVVHLTGTLTTSVPTIPVAPSRLLYSTSADHQNPSSLNGAALTGRVAIFAASVGSVSQVAFYLDGAHARTERTAPYDLAGDAGSGSHMLDTGTLRAGSHTLRAEVTPTSGPKYDLHATFTTHAVPPAGGKVLSVSGDQFRLDGQPFDMWGVRTASATYNQSQTDHLIAQLDVYKAHGVNTVTVYYMGSRSASYCPFSPDGRTVDAGHQARMEQIIKAAAARSMVVVTGLFYQAAPWCFASATAVREATRVVATKLKPYRNVIINIANEQNSEGYSDSNGMFDIGDPNRIIELLGIVHAVDPSRIAGGGGYDRSKNITIGRSSQANVLLFDTGDATDRVQLEPYRAYRAAGITKPMVNVEQFGGYTNGFARGVFSSALKAEYQREVASAHAEPGLSTFFHNGPWLQVLPMRYDLAGQGSTSDTGIRWYFEAVRSARSVPAG